MSQTAVAPAETLEGDDRLSFLIVRLMQTRLAIPAQRVSQLLLLPEVTRLPQAPPEVRGMINIRGELMPLLDLRVVLGMPSFIAETQEVIQTLNEREQDHKNWIAELQASVEQKRPFKLARNPHLCKFGKWYDTYRPQNQSVAFLSLWHSFDQPHRMIHGIADRVCALADGGDHAGAKAIIETTRGRELREIIELFAEARELLRQTTREVAMVLRQEQLQVDVSVDEVMAIEPLDHATVDYLSEMNRGTSSLTPQVAKRRGSGELALVLDTRRLLEYAKARANPAVACRG